MTRPTRVTDSTLHWSSIVARGPEAESFLQGQLSQDLVDASTPSGAWALLLAPDGIVITSCLRHRRRPTASTWRYRASSVRSRSTRLRRFLLRTKCTLELVERRPRTVYDTVRRADRRRPTRAGRVRPRPHAAVLRRALRRLDGVLHQGLLHRSRAGRAPRRARLERALALGAGDRSERRRASTKYLRPRVPPARPGLTTSVRRR